MKTVCIDEKIDKFIRENLTDKRICHVYAVRDTAVSLSKLYEEDERKAEIAALCHDLFKCFDIQTANEYVKKYGLAEKYLDNIDLSHSKLAAAYAKEDLKINDQDILNAISFHTTGRANMSRLEKIIYLADAIEPNRAYKEVEQIRKMSQIDLDKAVIMTLRGSIEMLKRLNKYIDPDTIEALNFMEGDRKEVTMEIKELALRIADILENKKAIDVNCIDIKEKSGFADYMVLASASSQRQLKALADEVQESLEKMEIFPKNIEGKANSTWILMDYGDIVVNIFTYEVRDQYKIEELWEECEFLSINSQK